MGTAKGKLDRRLRLRREGGGGRRLEPDEYAGITLCRVCSPHSFRLRARSILTTVCLRSRRIMLLMLRRPALRANAKRCWQCRSNRHLDSGAECVREKYRAAATNTP